VAIQAERHDEIWIVRFTMNVVILKQSIQKFCRDSIRFEPTPRYTCERLQAGVSAKEAEIVAPKSLLP